MFPKHQSVIQTSFREDRQYQKREKKINKSCFKSRVNICSWAHPTQKYILLFLVRVTMHLCILAVISSLNSTSQTQIQVEGQQ